MIPMFFRGLQPTKYGSNATVTPKILRSVTIQEELVVTAAGKKKIGCGGFKQPLGRMRVDGGRWWLMMVDGGWWWLMYELSLGDVWTNMLTLTNERWLMSKLVFVVRPCTLHVLMTPVHQSFWDAVKLANRKWCREVVASFGSSSEPWWCWRVPHNSESRMWHVEVS